MHGYSRELQSSVISLPTSFFPETKPDDLWREADWDEREDVVSFKTNSNGGSSFARFVHPQDEQFVAERCDFSRVQNQFDSNEIFDFYHSFVTPQALITILEREDVPDAMKHKALGHILWLANSSHAKVVKLPDYSLPKSGLSESIVLGGVRESYGEQQETTKSLVGLGYTNAQAQRLYIMSQVHLMPGWAQGSQGRMSVLHDVEAFYSARREFSPQEQVDALIGMSMLTMKAMLLNINDRNRGLLKGSLERMISDLHMLDADEQFEALRALAQAMPTKKPRKQEIIALVDNIIEQLHERTSPSQIPIALAELRERELHSSPKSRKGKDIIAAQEALVTAFLENAELTDSPSGDLARAIAKPGHSLGVISRLVEEDALSHQLVWNEVVAKSSGMNIVAGIEVSQAAVLKVLGRMSPFAQRDMGRSAAR